MSHRAEKHRKALSKAIRTHQQQILDDWLDQQLEADSLRLDLIDEKTLTQDSKEFLTILGTALQKDETLEMDSPTWRPVLAFLEELSQSRDTAGFSSTETATFVLSLKLPLMHHLTRDVDEDQDGESGRWLVSTTMDRLALFVTEEYQRRREQTIRRQREEMEELATPVVKIWDGILALPLVGTLDTRRSQMVTESLLEAIAQSGSEVAILDLTGVPAIDTRMAQLLMRTVAAARLMGARCILSGIRPQIAQTIVHLKIQLGDIETESTLASALRSAFRRSGLAVVDNQ